ncbi:hypothetical protein ACIPL1_09860 [Pseudomonas sp. NPDC090202]|uniref:DUF7079 family protein n=1 Tax=unclassified Pseudomonas TaxID=196821 RepID=UPI00381CA746
MELELNDQKLWLALSDIFVDTETDFPLVARAVKEYSLEEIEFALFERVAPVCIYNGLASVPPVCWFFNEKKLLEDIRLLIQKESKRGFFGKAMSKIKVKLIRLVYSGVWDQLKAEIWKQKTCAVN